MDVIIARECSRKESSSSLVAVKDEDGTWHVMAGVVPVVNSATGQWLHDGAGDEESVTEAPEWLVDILEPQAPEDWRTCRFEIRSIVFSRPGAPSRDDTVMLDAISSALRTEREARIRAEKALEDEKAKPGAKTEEDDEEGSDAEIMPCDDQRADEGPGEGCEPQGRRKPRK